MIFGIFQVYETRFYRVHGVGPSIFLESVPVSFKELDPRFVYILDVGLKIFLWYGKKAKNTLKSKARLMIEKINKNERKNRAEIIQEQLGDESEEFWKCLGVEEGEDPPTSADLIEHVSLAFEPTVPRLYQVRLGAGYLELPQVEIPQSKLVTKLLNNRNVYILDCFLDVFVWYYEQKDCQA